MQRSVPVLYYHRVGAPDPIHLSIPEDVFDSQMKFLARKSVNVISSSDLYKWIDGQIQIEFPAVCITFDDGFLDNYRFAHKILAKYNFKASVFIGTSFIRPEEQPAADEVAPFNEAHSLARSGDYSNFLSLTEIQAMIQSGIWEVYSHTHNHNQVFTSTELTGKYPETDNHWGILSAYGKALKGKEWPVFKRGAGLVNNAFVVKDMTNKCDVKLVEETEAEFETRIRKDLSISLEQINKISQNFPPLVCWPWGKADKRLEKIAKDVGYVGAFRTDSGPNCPGIDPMTIKRFPVKKKDLFRFALGIWLRSYSFTAKAYAKLRNIKLK